MTAIDTNIIVRLLTRDDEAQYNAALALFFEKNDIFISDTVILETEWVLRYAYDFSSNTICNALVKLLGLPNVKTTNAEALALAIEWARGKLDFADALHLALGRNHDEFVTFDKKFARRAKGLNCCPVRLL